MMGCEVTNLYVSALSTAKLTMVTVNSMNILLYHAHMLSLFIKS